MKLLLDACVWGPAKEELAAAGHDVIWAGDWDEDPGDEAILNRALRQARILITLDKDFGELCVVRRRPHRGIIRLVNCPARQQAATCKRILSQYEHEGLDGAIVTVEPGRTRFRPAMGHE